MFEVTELSRTACAFTMLVMFADQLYSEVA
jgi:hypothetical protein